jgi:TetR/AcrR family tetracycline transcriptional repressor
MVPAEERQRGLSRDRLVAAALALIQEEGLEGLSMRALAESLEVKAASLYWHVRDRGELLELLAESILDAVPRPHPDADWRGRVLAISADLGERVSSQKDATRILLEAPGALARSDFLSALTANFVAAGLSESEASDVALMAMTYVVFGRPPVEPRPEVRSAEAAELAIDSGSRGVVVRAGDFGMQTLVRVPHEQRSAAPAVVRGEKVTVRRLRGVGRGEIELNPGRPWRFHVQAPTWNTILDLGALDVRHVHIDSGAARVEIFLPKPRGIVPIQISSGVIGVALHRPHGTAAIANLSTGAVRVKLDDFATRAAVFDTRWESENASAARDRFEIQVSSGAVKVVLDSYARTAPPPMTSAPEPPSATQASALDTLLDGVEARVNRAATGPD